MIQILFAIFAGVLTVAAPCILPMLPILLGASVGQRSTWRPFFIVGGFVASFSVLSLLLSYIISQLGLSPNILRAIAVLLLAVFALLMIWPKPFELLTGRLSGVMSVAGRMGKSRGNFGGLLLGLILGLVWTPCAGPVLGSILTLIATQGSTSRSTILLSAYALGAGIPMVIIAYGSQWASTRIGKLARYATRIQQISGVFILLLAFAMYFQYDVQLETALLPFFPGVSSGLEQNLAFAGSLTGQDTKTGDQQENSAAQPQLTSQPAGKIALHNYGPAPEFSGIDQWLDSAPLTLKDLRGKVVLVDFWTYSCINCIRTLPFVTSWYEKYKGNGFVVIGVHTPEFNFEKVTDNVRTAIKRFGIHYPVAQDNEYATWNAYHNQFWPAEYLIDRYGTLVYTHFGEGNYDHTENAIRQLLGLGEEANAKTSNLGDIESPEMYFGTNRLENLTPGQKPSSAPHMYTLNKSLSLNTFALGGIWKFDGEKASLVRGSGNIRLRFSSAKVYIVAASENPVTLRITVDGKLQPDVTVQSSTLYTLFDSEIYGEHTLEIEIPEPGFEAFTFTFG